MTGSSQERQMVLTMLQEGRISAQEAEELLAALAKADASRHEDRGPRREPGPGCRDFSPELDLDLGDFGRKLREAARGFLEGLRKAAEGFPGGGTIWVTVERELSVPAEGASSPARVSFSGTSGDVSVRGTDEPRVSGTATIRVGASDEQAAKRAAEEIRVFTERRDELLEISVRAPGNGEASPRFEVNLELSVPRRLGVTIRTASGDLEVRDIAGDLDLGSASGNVRISSPRGALTVHTASGDVTVEDAAPTSMQAKSASGDLSISTSVPSGAALHLETASGDVSLRLPASSRARIEATSAGGEVTVRAPLTIEELTKGRVVGVLNSPEASIGVKTASGDVRIETQES